MSKPAQDMAQYGAIALEADQNHENDLLRRLGYKQVVGASRMRA